MPAKQPDNPVAPTQDATASTPGRPQSLSVSELTSKIKFLLEKNIPYVWIYGEISNISRSGAGHCYLTLKDAKSQISAVIFKGQQRHLRFAPENGLAVTALARLTVYEPRGTVQLIVEHMTPSGAGELQVAFEQLKAKLAAEGLFDADRKRRLPQIPTCIALVTSPTGAVVHDFFKVARRRFPGIHIHLEGVAVQGADAATEIVAALETLDRRPTVEVIVLARGGGSLEDLHAFNTEAVARAIFTARKPVVSAIGHETDFTIADFVADLRAPTPSAAAELTVPDQIALLEAVDAKRTALIAHLQRVLAERRSALKGLAGRLARPDGLLSGARLRLDDAGRRLVQHGLSTTGRLRSALTLAQTRLGQQNPLSVVQRRREQHRLQTDRLNRAGALLTRQQRLMLQSLSDRLAALSPYAVLERGYSIARLLPEGRVLKSVRDVKAGRSLEILLTDGALTATVTTEGDNG
jgi:exodeoxyribonuclease VII large subunit